MGMKIVFKKKIEKQGIKQTLRGYINHSSFNRITPREEMEDQDSVYRIKNSFRNPILESQSPPVPLCQPSNKLHCAGRDTIK